MSIKLNTEYPSQANAPTSEYPTGSFKNKTAPGVDDGTPLEQTWANDMLGARDAILKAAGETANGRPDTADDSQVLDALTSLFGGGQDVAALRRNALVQPDGEPQIKPIPASSDRARGVLGFDVSGQPIAVAGVAELRDLTRSANDAADRAVAAAEASGPRRFYDNYASALADLNSIPDGAAVEIFTDETHEGHRTLYINESGLLVFKVDFDGWPALLATSSGAGRIGYSDSVPYQPGTIGYAVSRYAGADVDLIRSFIPLSQDLEFNDYPSPGEIYVNGSGMYTLSEPGVYSFYIDGGAVRVRSLADGVSFTISSPSGLILSADGAEDVIVAWNQTNNEWAIIEGDGVYLYLAVSSLRSINSEIGSFFQSRADKQTEESLRSTVDANVEIVQQLSRRIRNLEISVGNKTDQEVALLMEACTRMQTDEIMRGMGGSGIYNVRNYNNDTGFSPKQRPFDVSYSAISSHAHLNYYNTLGLGEISALINGLFIRTTHNDPWLTYSIPGATAIDGTNGSTHEVEEFVGAATPPPVPADVLARPHGITFTPDPISTSFTYTLPNGDKTQCEYFRNLFSNPEYIKDCRWDLMYLEVAIERIGTAGRLFNYASSARHNQTGNTLKELMSRSAYIAASGLKNVLENDAFQAGVVAIQDEKGDPVFAYVNYRIRVKTVGTPSAMRGRFGEGQLPPVIYIGEASGALGLHPHFFDSAWYAFGGNAYQALPLSIEQGNWCLDNPGQKLTLKTSVDTQHLHYLDVWQIDNEWFAEDRAVVSVSGDVNEGGHKHPLRIVVPSSNIPFDLYKAVEGISDDTNRFLLVRDVTQLERMGPGATWKDLALSNRARFTLAEGLLESLCQECYGFDGEGANIVERMTLPGSANYQTLNASTATPLNAAKYNREFGLGTADASNRAASLRGFNDPTLYTAKTTNPNIVHGYTYMIPLEMILRTPAESWNPYGVDIYPAKDDYRDESYYYFTRNAPVQRASYFGGYYLLPSGFYFSNRESGDSADTGGSTSCWIKAGNGEPVKTVASGIAISKNVRTPVYFDPNGNEYSRIVRFRYPVYPVFHEFTYESIQLGAVKRIIQTALKRIRSGSMTDSDIDQLF